MPGTQGSTGMQNSMFFAVFSTSFTRSRKVEAKSRAALAASWYVAQLNANSNSEMAYKLERFLREAAKVVVDRCLVTSIIERVSERLTAAVRIWIAALAGVVYPDELGEIFRWSMYEA